MSHDERLYEVVCDSGRAFVDRHFLNIQNGLLSRLFLDQCHYYSMPGFCLDAALKMTKLKLDLFSEVDEYNFIENSVRGGSQQSANDMRRVTTCT